MELHPFETAEATVVPAPTPEKLASISIVGLGYVGAVSTACLAHLGHQVIGVDMDQDKVESVGRGESPIHEKDLELYLREGVDRGLISTTDDLAAAVRETDVTFISVGTPTAADGGCDYSYIEEAARSMGVGLAQKKGFHVFAMRCSIPPGTTMKIMAPILEKISGKTVGRDFGICFNPEFLREGVAIADFHTPPKTVIGTTDLRSANIMRQIYAPVDPEPILVGIEAAEMVKYVDNVWHATKVCFANEVGRLCKPFDVDSHVVMDVFTQDTKLNLSSYYLKPGFAYGGSCLPKEVRAVQHMAESAGVELPMMANLDISNKTHIEEAYHMVKATGAKRIGVLGIAFKAGTDDLRESPILEVMAALKEEGHEIVAHDDAITVDTALDAQLGYVKHASGGLRDLVDDLPQMLRGSAEDVMKEADVIIVAHKNATYRRLVRNAPHKNIVDLVRLFDAPPTVATYSGIAW